MRYVTCLFVPLWVGVFSQTPAAEPAASDQSAATAVAAPTAAPTHTPAATTPAASDVPAEAPKEVDREKQAKRLRAMGYRPKVQNGRTIYCRSEAILGSRFEKSICGSADDIDKATQNSKDFTEGVQRNTSNPAKP